MFSIAVETLFPHPYTYPKFHYYIYEENKIGWT